MRAKRSLDPAVQFRAILWYFITVFNENRHFITVIMMYLPEINFKEGVNVYDINKL
jgi:hypothetical protein